MFTHSIGIALGGGGARGPAHLGVLRHLEEIKVPLSAISGTSAGAIVAALWAFRVPHEQITEAFRTMRPAEITGLNWRGLGLFHNHALEAILKRLLPENAQIQDASIRLGIVASDLITGQRVCMTHGDVIPAVLASSAVPGFYTPVSMDGMLLADGGLTENVPVSVLKSLGAQHTIAVTLHGQNGYGEPSGILDVVSNAMDIAIDTRTHIQLKEADQVIAIDLARYPRTNARFLDEVMAAGYQAAQAAIPNRASLLRHKHWTRAVAHFFS